jgi:hypothetical protein
MRGRAVVLRRLDAEWTDLQGDPRAADVCRRWAAKVPALKGCATPAGVLRRVPADPDAVLGALLAEAAADGRLAGRVVLQALLPKMVRMAAVDPAAEVDDYVTALWCGIAAYPLARRPRSVAANLALDTLKAVRRERHAVADLVTAPELVVLAADRVPQQVVGSPPGSAGPSVRHVLDLARRHGLVDASTRDLLHSVYAEGLTGASAARRHGLSPAVVRVRCSRAIKVLAGHAELLALG